MIEALSASLKSIWKDRPLFLAGLSMLVVGLPLSLFLTSLSQFVLAGSFFLEGPFLPKFRKFFRTPAAMAIAMVWLIHVVGLLWTQDIAEGLKDVRIKLPLLTLPVILAGNAPLHSSQFRFILRLFVSSVVAGSLVSSAVLAGIIHVPIDDVRDVFIFKISHIRFALFTCLSVIICLESVLQEKTSYKSLWALTAIWLVAFLFLIESMTGISILLVLTSTYVLLRLRGPNRLLLVTILAGILAVGGWLAYETRQAYITASKEVDSPLDFSATTAEGRPYSFDTTLSVYENGHRVWAYVCEVELEREWNRRSRVPYHSDNELYQPIRTCLIRFLTSKNLRKDAAGVNQLRFEEIQAVESGVANVNYLGESGLEKRIQETAWELVQFQKGYDANDHSVMQRFEYWSTAYSILLDHPWTGAGTGDVKEAFDRKYEERGSTLRPENRLRSHNQFLTIGTALGIPAVVFFISVMCYLLLSERRPKDVLLLASWLILMLSMLTEDTLETQPGATFFAMSLSLFLFSRPKSG